MAIELGSSQVQAQLERFAKLPKPYRIAAMPLLAALVIGLYGYLFFLPARAELGVAEGKEREAQRKVSEVKAIVGNLAAFEQELGDLEKKLTVALRTLPDSKELPVLLTDVSSLGKDSGLEFKLFRPQEEVARDFYAEVPIDIEFSGGYHDIAGFFDKISKLPRIVNVSRLEMVLADKESESTRLSVKGQATTFRFIEHAPEAKAPQTGAAPQKPGAAAPKAAAAPQPHGGRS
jgi:type IV pilus assembly protein PilO